MRTLPTRAENQGPEVSFMSPFQPNQTSWCGHRIDVNRPPRTNCEQCWSYFFINNSQFTQAVGNELLKEDGEQTVTKMYGTKFLKKAKWFFTAVAKAKADAEAINRQIETEQLLNTDVDLVIPAPVIEEVA